MFTISPRAKIFVRDGKKLHVVGVLPERNSMRSYIRGRTVVALRLQTRNSIFETRFATKKRGKSR